MLRYIIIDLPTEEQISRIAELYIAQGWMQSCEQDGPQIVRKLIAGSHCFVVASDGNDIVGMGRAISDGSSDAYIQDMTVRHNRRNQGIASKILQILLEKLHRDGIHWIGLIAEPGSYNLYKKAGFRKMPKAVPMLMKSE